MSLFALTGIALVIATFAAILQAKKTRYSIRTSLGEEGRVR